MFFCVILAGLFAKSADTIQTQYNVTSMCAQHEVVLYVDACPLWLTRQEIPDIPHKTTMRS